MRDRDSLMLESIYMGILLKENTNGLSSFTEEVLDKTAHGIKYEFNSNYTNYEVEIHLKDEIIKKLGYQIDYNDSYKMAYEMFLTNKHLKVEPSHLPISTVLFYTYQNEARQKYLNPIYYAKSEKKRITKEEYDELRYPDEIIKTYSLLGDSYLSNSYLNAILSNGLSNIYDPEEWDDPEYIAENNSDVNVLTIMNNILYPVKGMEKFHDMYESLFKTIVVEENPKNPSYPKVKLFNPNSESKIAENSLINYLGEKEFLLHKQFLNILAHMVVYQFKDDPNLEGDYSSLLYMSAFVF